MAAKPENWIHFRCPVCRRHPKCLSMNPYILYCVGNLDFTKDYKLKIHFKSGVIEIPPTDCIDALWIKWFYGNWL